jgi:hypothetical protein
MKNILILFLMLAGMISNKLQAQPSELVGKEKMKAFGYWAGRWQGEGSIQMGPGQPKKSAVDEHMEFKLEGMVLLIEGIGKGVEETNKGNVVHHALGILSFDQATNQYVLNSYLKDGKNTQAWFNILEENKYQWGFDVPNGKIKYTITLEPAKNTWNEIGEFSKDNGSTWMKFFEMNLKKQS